MSFLPIIIWSDALIWLLALSGGAQSAVAGGVEKRFGRIF
jgi:hypothetical protein